MWCPKRLGRLVVPSTLPSPVRTLPSWGVLTVVSGAGLKGCENTGKTNLFFLPFVWLFSVFLSHCAAALTRPPQLSGSWFCASLSNGVQADLCGGGAGLFYLTNPVTSSERGSRGHEPLSRTRGLEGSYDRLSGILRKGVLQWIDGISKYFRKPRGQN